jgi:hypothetical protein
MAGIAGTTSDMTYVNFPASLNHSREPFWQDSTRKGMANASAWRRKEKAFKRKR